MISSNTWSPGGISTTPVLMNSRFDQAVCASVDELAVDVKRLLSRLEGGCEKGPLPFGKGISRTTVRQFPPIST